MLLPILQMRTLRFIHLANRYLMPTGARPTDGTGVIGVNRVDKAYASEEPAFPWRGQITDEPKVWCELRRPRVI